MEMAAIRMVPDDVQVWLVYAGYRRRHLDLFLRSRSIFLELPGFDAAADTFRDDYLMRQHLAHSNRVRRWLLDQGGNPPPRNPRAVPPPVFEPKSPEARSFSAEMGNIYHMFRDVKVGDIVLCPPIGHYNRFLIGEITENWDPRHVLAVPFFEDEQVPVRKVRWLSTEITRRDFPPVLARHLQNQHAISEVDQGFTEDILRLIYNNFAWREKSKVDIFGRHYTGDDPVQLNDAAFLIKYTLAAVTAFYDARLEEFQQLEPGEAVRVFYDKNRVEHFRINFNSPGKFETIFSRKSASSLISMLLTIVTAPRGKGIATAKAEAADQVKEAMRGDDPQVCTDIDRLKESLRDDRWNQVRNETGVPADESLDIQLDEERIVGEDEQHD